MSYLAEFVGNQVNEVEIAKGVFIERRSFLKLSVVALCGIMLGSNSILKGEDKIVVDENIYDIKNEKDFDVI